MTTQLVGTHPCIAYYVCMDFIIACMVLVSLHELSLLVVWLHFHIGYMELGDHACEDIRWWVN